MNIPILQLKEIQTLSFFLTIWGTAILAVQSGIKDFYSLKLFTWKLLKFYETDRVELYNLDDDPGEENNVAEQMPEQRDQLKKQLETWLQKTDAPMPSWPEE